MKKLLSDPLAIKKTYKLYIKGLFVRSESGRHQTVIYSNLFSHNIPWASKKDLRNAVEAAENAIEKWQSFSAYNRGQIIYRMAEMLEEKRSIFKKMLQNFSEFEDQNIDLQIDKSVDVLVYYAGWADKYEQIYSNINPTPQHFNLSLLEPVGLTGIIAPYKQGLLGIVGSLLPALVGGNTSVLLVDKSLGNLALTFSEILHTSDLPAGVVNILTTHEDDLVEVLAQHQSIKALVYYDLDQKNTFLIKEKSADSVKIVIDNNQINWFSENALSPSLILDLQEIKTLWHPIMPLQL